MEVPSPEASKDNTATIQAQSGTTANSIADDKGATSLNITSSSSGLSSNGTSSGSSRAQSGLKMIYGTMAANGVQSQRSIPSQAVSARQKKAAAGVELKSRIIDFMRDKPYLWNKWHPGYNDNKRRENEFSTFSQNIGYPVTEIKRVWHVLRTNFFRAHKIQGEKEPAVFRGGQNREERCWKYYQSMKFILDGSPGNNNNNNKIMRDDVPNSNGISNNEDSLSSIKDVRRTRSSKVLKLSRGSKRMVQRQPPNQSLTSHNSDSSSNNSSNVPPALLIIPATTTTPTTAMMSTSTTSFSTAPDSNITFSSGNHKSNNCSSNLGRGLKLHHQNMMDDEDHETSVASGAGGGGGGIIGSDQVCMAQGRQSAISSFNGMSRISFDADDDHLYARSLTATLKKFDSTTKEVIKLKFQEIIVEYMQKQQQQPQQ